MKQFIILFPEQSPLTKNEFFGETDDSSHRVWTIRTPRSQRQLGVGQTSSGSLEP